MNWNFGLDLVIFGCSLTLKPRVIPLKVSSFECELELQYEVEEEGLTEEEAYKDLFNFGMKRASSDDDYDAYDDDDYDDDEYDEDYDNYEDYEDYDEEGYDADHPHPPDLEDGNAQPDSGSKASTDQQQQHRQHHGHHHHGHHHGVSRLVRFPKGCTETEQRFSD